MLSAEYALFVAVLAYTVGTVHSLKGELDQIMSFISDANTKLDAQGAKIDAAAARVIAALANVVSDADAAAILAKVDANSAKVDAFATAPAPPAP